MSEEEELMAKKNHIVDHLQAEMEFDKFCEAWYIDNEVDTMKSDEDRDSFLKCKREIIRYVRDGHANFSEDGTEVKLVLRKVVLGKEEVSLKVPTGTAFMAMDQYKEGKHVHKFHAFMADVAKVSPVMLSKMSGIDIRFFQQVFSLFLG